MMIEVIPLFTDMGTLSYQPNNTYSGKQTIICCIIDEHLPTAHMVADSFVLVIDAIEISVYIGLEKLAAVCCWHAVCTI